MRKFLIFLLFAGVFAFVCYALLGPYLGRLAGRFVPGLAEGSVLVAQDRAGRLYALQRQDGWRLTALALENGKPQPVYRRALAKGLPPQFTVADFYGAQDTLLLSIYWEEEEALRYGLYVSQGGEAFAPLLTESCQGAEASARQESVALSAISEYGDSLRFFIKVGERGQSYRYHMPEGLLAPEGDFPLEGPLAAGIVAEDGTVYYAGPAGDLFAVRHGGAAPLGDGGVLLPAGKFRPTATGTGFYEARPHLYSKFMQMGNGFAYVNGIDGGLYRVDFETQAHSLALGAENFQGASGLSAGALGVVRIDGQALSLFSTEGEGGLALTEAAQGPAWAAALTLGAIALGAVVFPAFLCYYFFTETRKRYFPTLLQSALALGLCAAVLNTVALKLFIRPYFLNQARAAAFQGLAAQAAALARGVALPFKEDARVFRFYFDDQAPRLLDPAGPYGKDFLVDATRGLEFLRGDLLRAGTPYAAPGPGRTTYVALAPVPGGWLAYTEDGRLTEAGVDAFCQQLAGYMALASAGVIVAALFILGRLVNGMARVRHALNSLCAGQTDFELVQPSRDELQLLVIAANNLARDLTRLFKGHKLRQESYLMFIPEQLVSLLGVDAIEEVSKTTASTRAMTVMVAQFQFSGQDYAKDAGLLFDNINAVMGRTSSVVTNNGGIIYNFTYDGYDAVFHSAPEAVSAAVAIRQEIMALNRERDQVGKALVTLRAALDTDTVMMGIVGDDRRITPTAVSTGLNMARRLVALAARLDANILCTMEVAEAAPAYSLRYIGKSRLSDGEARVYEIFDGDEYPVRLAKEKQRQRFSEGVYNLYSRNFSAAKRIFIDLVRSCPEDGVSRHYLYLSDKYETEPVEELFLSGRQS